MWFYWIFRLCKCRKKLVDKLIDECTETIEEIKLANITFTENENNYEHISCKVYIVLTIVVFIIFTGITAYFITIGLWLKIILIKKTKNLMSEIL